LARRCKKDYKKFPERAGGGGHQSLLDARVDSNVAAEKKLAGKPARYTFEEAARMLGASPERAVVVEDAISGTMAG
jgi:HAD superfamily hydrolase (TIGR01509 family)